MTEEWFAYDWELRGVPAQFLVDLQYGAAFAAMPRHTTLIYVTCSTGKPARGRFSCFEKRRLDKILKTCRTILTDETVYVGRIDLPGQRSFYFYTPDARLLVPLYDACQSDRGLHVACSKADEPRRQTYYRLLYPDAAKSQSANNKAYIASLAARGDDVAAPRRVNLHFCFPTTKQMEPFLTEVKSLGFAVGKTDCNTAYELPFTVALHKVSEMELAKINALTTAAIQAAAPYGGVFDRLDSAFVEKRLR